MSEELLYTSAPKGLKQGSRGFCTVVASAGMTPQMATLLESLSGYRHLAAPGSPSNPIVWRHLTATVGGRAVHVLSRVSDAGTDYSGRTNKLAHHVAVPANELNAAGPAWTQRQPATHETVWNGETRVLTAGRPLAAGAVGPKPCEAWKRLTGDAGWGGVLAQRLMDGVTAPIPLIYPATADPLTLLAETIALLPESMRWRATYTTLHTSIPPGVVCAWRFVLDGTTEAETLRKRPDLERIDLTGRLAAPPAGPWVEAARSGVRPAGKTVAPSPTPPAGGAPAAPAAPSPFDAQEAYELASPDPSRPLPPPPRRRRQGAESDSRRPERSTSLIAVTAVALIGLTMILAVPVGLLWGEIGGLIGQFRGRLNSVEQAGRQQSAKEQAEQSDAQRELGDREQAGKEQAAKEQAEREQAEREQAEREQAEREQAEREKAEREKAEREKAEREKAQRERSLFDSPVVWCELPASEQEVSSAYFTYRASKSIGLAVDVLAPEKIAQDYTASLDGNTITVTYGDPDLYRTPVLTLDVDNEGLHLKTPKPDPSDRIQFFAIAVSHDGNRSAPYLVQLKRVEKCKPFESRSPLSTAGLSKSLLDQEREIPTHPGLYDVSLRLGDSTELLQRGAEQRIGTAIAIRYDDSAHLKPIRQLGNVDALLERLRKLEIAERDWESRRITDANPATDAQKTELRARLQTNDSANDKNKATRQKEVETNVSAAINLLGHPLVKLSEELQRYQIDRRPDWIGPLWGLLKRQRGAFENYRGVEDLDSPLWKVWYETANERSKLSLSLSSVPSQYDAVVPLVSIEGCTIREHLYLVFASTREIPQASQSSPREPEQ